MEFGLITPSIVHKGSSDDVLITEGHFLVPMMMSHKVTNDLSEESEKALEKFYMKTKKEFILKGLDESKFDYEGFSSSLNDSASCYNLDLSDRIDINYYDYANNVSEKCNVLSVKDFENIFYILKEIIDFKTDFYSTMYVNTNNYYFYRKHHEHVPGVMIIEAARQAMYTQLYHSCEVQRGNVSVSIDSLNTKFFHYVNAHYPVHIWVSDVDPNLHPIIDKKVHKLAKFYQDGKLVAEVTLTGPVISLKTFDRLCRTKINHSQYFVPTKNIASTIFLNFGQDKLIEADLRALSINKFLVEMDSKDKIEASEKIRSTLFIDGIGYIHCHLKFEGFENIGKTQKTILSVEKISKDCQKKLNLAIKNFTLIDKSTYHGGPHINE
jgi:hypothetical protein|tara:strand:+ start:3417 stop:4559 length:1143 start_codon:yes stop_codon:yes gene_type:complete